MTEENNNSEINFMNETFQENKEPQNEELKIQQKLMGESNTICIKPNKLKPNMLPKTKKARNESFQIMQNLDNNSDD